MHESGLLTGHGINQISTFVAIAYIKYLCHKMSRYRNSEIITAIQNGEEEILFYLSKKYFQSSRKWLRRNGCKDAETPGIFSKVLVKICREIQQNNISTNVDFELFLFNSIKDFHNLLKKEKSTTAGLPDNDMQVITSCYNILDDSYSRILSARYSEKMSYEQIASRFEFSNPVIAQFELDKAFRQFENIVRARLNITSN